MPYDTVIDEGENGFIPDSPQQAMDYNVMKLTRITAVTQIEEMVDLVDVATREVAVKTVAGEEVTANSNIGVKIYMAK